jgi:thiol-disulfide isomerase/thioredoxin
VSEADAAGARPRTRRWRRIAIELAIVAAVFLAVRAYQRRDLAGGAAPALPRAGLEGALPERPRVVHFFASWCGVCEVETGNVRTLAAHHEVLAIASQSGGERELRAYLAEHDLGAAHVAIDPSGELARRFGVSAFPATFFLDDRGRVVSAEVGYTTTLGLLARAWWAQ